MFRRVLCCLLTALALCLTSATVSAADSGAGTPAPPRAARYSIYTRKPGTVSWSEHRSYRTAAEAKAAARELHEHGLEVQVHSCITMTHVPARPASGSLPVSETITFRQAARIFRWLASQPDIAFRFPRDGCYARAHLMIRRLEEHGYTPFKVWSFANGTPLHVSTTNHPDGYVEWRYHIAPVLRVRFENGVQAWYVFDPSLFRAPATITEWRDAQKKPGSRYTPYVTLTRLGQAPRDVHGARLPGSGYWPGPDPREGLDAHATKTMRLYKRQQGRGRSRAVVMAVGGRKEKLSDSLSSRPFDRDKSLESVRGVHRDCLVTRTSIRMESSCGRIVPPATKPHLTPMFLEGLPCFVA